MAISLSFWQKWKVPVTGAIGAIILALLPVLQPSNTETTVASLVMAAVVGLSSWFAKNIRGKAQSIGGIIFSIAIAVLPVVFTDGVLDWKEIAYMVLSQIAALFFGYSGAPMKPASYEHNATIVAAKTIPPKNQVKDTGASATEIITNKKDT